MKIDKEWLNLVVKLDFAFQPIVCTKTGKIFAVEAFVRGTEKLGYQTISEFFNQAFKRNELYNTDLLLRSKALYKFIDIDIENIMMFYNIDNRILFDKSYSKGNTTKILEKLELTKKSICFEINEKDNILMEKDFEKILKNYKNEGFKIALDDFGKGISSFKLLYDNNPDFLKIDDFFIRSIDSDRKKQFILKSIVSLAHQFEIKVIAKGVETLEELKLCQEYNVDCVQGYYIQKPQLYTKNLQEKYDIKIISN
jgi:EAL domain-containing protein (putative c-di-GMP-specific phosphodiesterase class I)